MTEPGDIPERSAATERRRATVMFADLTGFTSLVEQRGDEEAYELVTGCLKVLDTIARKHGASVDKYMGDCVMAVFGVPRAIEDAPRAALNAAIEMRRRTHEYRRERGVEDSLDIHIGINSGRLISGDISGPVMREFAVLGDTVNVAARLKDLAPAGTIWLGEETWRETRSRFEFRTLRALKLKGKDVSVGAYELLSADERIYRAPVGARRDIFSELVGRDEELAALREQLEGVVEGRGGLASLVGEAGLGKSRLLSELAALAEGHVTWLRGRSLSIGQNLGFHPFADLLRGWSGIREDDGDEEALARLSASAAELFPSDHEEVTRILATLMGVRLPVREQRKLQAIQGEAMEKLVLATMTRLLRKLAETRPVVVVFDDLHWADLSSIELLESLLRLSETHALLFVLVYRPRYSATEQLQGRVRKRFGERHGVLRLSPLNEQAARQLIDNLLGGGDVPPRICETIEEKAAGNPFFVEEVVRSLIDDGAVEPRDGALWATVKLENVVVPGTIEEVVRARLDGLGHQRLHVVQVASVIGLHFHYDVLARVLSEDTLADDVRYLIDAELILPSRDDLEDWNGTEFDFKHPLIQEVAYQSVLQNDRQQRHLEIGRAIEDTLSESTPGLNAMLAYHFSVGRDLERAEEYLLDAGDEAAASAASNEALHFFQESSKLYLEIHGEGGDPAKQALLEKNVGLAFFNRGQLAESIEYFDRALGHLGARVPKSQPGLVARSVSSFATVLARLYLPFGGRQRPAATDFQREIIAIIFKRAAAQATSDPTRLVLDSLDGLRWVSKVDPRTVPDSAAMYSCAVFFSYGGISFSIPRRCLAIARELVEQGEVQNLQLTYRFMNFIHHLLEGDWSEEHAIAPEIIEQGLQLGQVWDATSAINLAGIKKLYQGDFSATAGCIEQLAKVADLYQHELAGAARDALVAFLHLERRELPEALAAIEGYCSSYRDSQFQISGLGTKAKIEALMGRFDAADATLESAARAVARAGRVPPPYHLSSYVCAGYRVEVAKLESARQRGEPATRRQRKQAREWQRRAVDAASKVAWRRGEVHRLVGRHAWALGKQRAAFDAFGRSLEQAGPLGARPELARTLAEIARRLGSDGAPDSWQGRSREDLIAEARREFTALGLDREAEQIAGIAAEQDVS